MDTANNGENDPDAQGDQRAGNGLILFVLGAGGFTSALNVTMLSPLLVDIADHFDVSEATAGQLATVTAASAGIMALVVAPWTDRYPRRFWLRLECILLAIGALVSALAPELGWMFAGRVLAGMGSAVLGANCLAACSDLYPNKADRNRAIGLINSAFTLGAVIGLPIITLIASWFGWRTAVALPALCAVLVIAGSTRLPVTVQDRSGSLWNAWKGGYGRVFASRETVLILLSLIGFMIIWFGWLIYFGAYAEKTHAVTAAMLSVLFLVGGGAELIGNNVSPWLIKRTNTRTVATIGLGIAMLTLLLTGIAWTGGWTLFPYIAIGSFALAIMFIAMNLMLLDSLPGDPGAAMSLQSACFEVGGAIGVALTGLILTVTSNNYDRTYQILALFFPFVAVLVWRSARYHRPTVAPEPKQTAVVA